MICALIEGSVDPSPWTKFLDMLRDAVEADYATLIFRPPGRGFAEAVSMLSGGSLDNLHREYASHLYPNDLMANRDIAEGCPQSLKDVLGNSESGEFSAHRQFIEKFGIKSLRQVRVQETSGIDAWLTIARRSEEDFAPAVDHLLSQIAPILRSVLGQYIVRERERFESMLAADAVRRMNFGWLTLDEKGRVLDCDAQGADVLSRSGVLRRSLSGQLVAASAPLQAEINEALKLLAHKSTARARAIALSRDPWLDMLLLPAERTSISARVRPVAIAYVHGDSWHEAECGLQLAELFRLSAREAEIALALCRGMTISEVAAELGVTVGTARNHTKSIYAKIGARGLPDLVRVVMRSILSLTGVKDLPRPEAS